MEKKVKNILITGATGFIGKNLMKSLDDSHHYFLLSRKEIKSNSNFNFNFTSILGSLEKINSIEDLNVTMDLIINLAAETKDEAKMLATNVKGVEELCTFANKYQVKKIIQLSSVGVIGQTYSPKKIILDDNSICIPDIKYEVTKLRSEEILKEFASKNNIELLILRPTNVFGEDHPKKSLLNIMELILRKKKIPLVKNARVNYVYVKDLIQLIIYGMNNSLKNQTYIVGNSIEINRFLEIIANNLQASPNIQLIPLSLVKLLLNFKFILGIDRINKLKAIANFVEYDGSNIILETKLNYYLESGISNTVNYYKQIGQLK